MSQASRTLRAFILCSVSLAAACSDATTSSVVQTTTQASNTTPTTSAACTTPLTLPAGGIVTGITGGSVCIAGQSASAEYALVAFNGGASGTSTSLAVTAAGVSAPSASTDLLSSAGTLPSASLSLSQGLRANRSFELGLRMMERTELPALVPAARAWAAGGRRTGVALDIIPSTVAIGQFLRLNANAKAACGSAIYRTGRIAAITARAIVVADTMNPAGGFTDAEYASLGAAFDTLVDPVDRAAFGDPSDIDGNGKVVVFFTKAVNDLTPATSSSYIGGFFFSRDLFPPSGSASTEVCAGSNKGEMFYMMVPDPSRGGAFAKASVATDAVATLAHEYQHLINASRRLYVNTSGADFEETWLDEGLAHVAEELVFYHAAGLSPRSNIDPTVIRSSTRIRDAFNNHASSNFGRFYEYLSSPSAFSPYADNDSLATRGATWSFLRYAADRRATTDGTVWYSLVNSDTTGIGNLKKVFGAGVANEIRDWGISVIADDVAGVPSTYQQPSWNIRAIYSALTNSGTFPLTTIPLTSSSSLSLVGGANAYFRFAVPASGNASVQWPAASTSVQMSLVRIR